jgi:hypothetical protein
MFREIGRQTAQLQLKAGMNMFLSSIITVWAACWPPENLTTTASGFVEQESQL